MHTYKLGVVPPWRVWTIVAGLVACGAPRPPQTTVMPRGDDLFALGAAPDVRDSIAGDVVLAGRVVQFTGAAGGDYLGAGGTQVIQGHVHGALRAAGGELTVNSTVDRNATMAGGTVRVQGGTVINRNAYLAGGDVQVDGIVHGALAVSGGTVTLNGTTDRDVDVTARKLIVGPTAVFRGALRYRVPAGDVHIDPRAQRLGATTALPVETARGPGAVVTFLWFFGFLVAGAVIVALLPRLMGDAAEQVRERPGRATLVGLGWIVLVPILAVIVACTIIGLPLAFLMGALYVLLLYTGRVVVALWLGKRLLGTRVANGRGGVLTNFVVGGLALLIVRLIPVIGPLVMVIATVVGLGALLFRIHTLRMTTAGVAFV